MKANIRFLKDNIGQNYLGITIYEDSIVTFLEHLKDLVGDNYDKLTQNQKKRDLGSYHITVINTTEYNSLLSKFGADRVTQRLESILDKQLDITLLGLGKAQKDPNIEYFVVVKSEMLQEVRRIFGLKPKDFVVTIGFNPGEVFGVPKNSLVDIKDPFIKLLSQNFYNFDQSFDFLKELDYFDFDKEKEIEVIKIEPNFATFRVETNYFTVSLLGDKLGISAKWQETKNKPKLSDTIISRKLKNI
jgi:hypothetical protein